MSSHAGTMQRERQERSTVATIVIDEAKCYMSVGVKLLSWDLVGSCVTLFIPPKGKQ